MGLLGWSSALQAGFGEFDSHMVHHISLEVFMRVESNCLYCKEVFLVEKKEINRGFGKFCCVSHGAKYNGEKRVKEKKANVKCSFCKCSFYKSKSRQGLSKSGLFFCKRECKDQAQMIESGFPEIRPRHFKSGESSFVEKARKHLEQKCNRCGYDEFPVLEVHHKDRNRKNNALSNLEMLCPTCHEVEHYKNKDGRYKGNKMKKKGSVVQG